MQPYHTELGAGTSNPATFLRSLGPHPWKAAYVEPCIRPPDGRYGENPFRFQHYFQYQVILKPAPENVLDLYFGSLSAIGIDTRAARHQARRGRLGAALDRRLGPRLGGVVRRHGDHAVHVLPAGWRHRAGRDPRRDHDGARAAGDVSPGEEERVRPRVGAGSHVGGRLPRERAPVVGLQLRGGAGGRPRASLRRARGRVCAPDRAQAAAARVRPGAEVLAPPQRARRSRGASRPPSEPHTSSGRGISP